MNFDLADLRAFVAVADLGSFSAAAQSLHLSQPALSRRVDKLETALGMRLFERTTRRVELNAMGRSFLPKARHVLNELDGSLLGMRDLAERLRGQVTVACVPSAVGNLIAGAARAFHQQFPNVVLRLLDEAAPDVLMAVARAEADFGVTYMGTQEPDLVFQSLMQEPFVVACRRDHVLAGRRRVAWSELAQHDYLTLAPGSGNRLLIDQVLTVLPRRPRWICEVKHVPALVSLVGAGLGVAVVPRLALPDQDGTGLVAVPLVDPPLMRTIGVLTRRGHALTAAAQAFLDLLLARRA